MYWTKINTGALIIIMINDVVLGKARLIWLIWIYALWFHLHYQVYNV